MCLLLLTSVERFVYVSNQIENDKGPKNRSDLVVYSQHN